MLGFGTEQRYSRAVADMNLIFFVCTKTFYRMKALDLDPAPNPH